MRCAKLQPKRGLLTVMISLDTNVVLRFLLNDVPPQTQKATKIIQDSQVYVTDVIVVEVIYVLEKVYMLGRSDVCTLVVNFLGFANVIYNTRFLLETVQRYEQYPALSIVDCYAAAEAKDYNNQLVTFDKRLATQGGQHINLL